MLRRTVATAVKRLTLSGFFALATAAVALIVAGAMVLLLRQSRRAVFEESDKLQAAAAARVEAEVSGELHRASRALEDLERAITAGAISVTDPLALEAPLLIRLLADPHLQEVTFTRADLRGYSSSGDAELGSAPRFQVAVQRSLDGSLTTRMVKPGPAVATAATAAPPAAPSAPPPAGDDRDAGSAMRYQAAMRQHALAGAFPSAPLTPAGDAADPTQDLTFSVIAKRALRDRLVWSDLHYAEADRALPEAQRRIVLTVQKAIFAPAPAGEAGGGGAAGDLGVARFLGVLRCGLMTRDLDAIAQLLVEPQSRDPQRVALLATTGGGGLRLVTRVTPKDRIESVDGELRVTSEAPPAELAALLRSSLAKELDGGAQRRSGVVDVGGVPWRATLAMMPPVDGGIAGWVVAVLVAEEHYTRSLLATQRNVLIGFALTLALLLVIGGAALAAVRRDLAKIVTATARMRAFDFSPASGASWFRDVDDAMAGLERAKTVVRAMGKYIPMDLVRRLYANNAEPVLGGEPVDVSIMFTDIEGFTTMAEKMPVAELALRLGAYLEAMTQAIEATDGTIDKYIGDAVMAVWNAPSPVPNHATAACAAALACIRATDALYASPQWAGLPPLVTRFGLHRARVLVGHFGAPTRLAYTALGDGVNLAARLEPLCKQYGVRLLVSEDIFAEAKAAFRFRRIDRVAVKGKQAGVDIYELIGPLDRPSDNQAALDGYAAAFEAYLAREFTAAADALQPHVADDPPSAALAARCRQLAAAPPPPEWNGVHVATSK
jgi:adenylate cyclase